MSLLIGRGETEHAPNCSDDRTRLQNMSSEWIVIWFLRVLMSFIYVQKQITILCTKGTNIFEGSI